MNLENLTHADFPFNHWVFSNCLEEGALDEISYSNIPSGDRMYDGTCLLYTSPSPRDEL